MSSASGAERVRSESTGSGSDSGTRNKNAGDSLQWPVRRVGKYKILSELGRGGMSNVFLAVAKGPGGVNKLVVLKALLPELAAEPDALSMFLDEARLAAQLNHANVVQTYEVGTEGDRHVMVMEYLEGQSLSSITRRADTTGRQMSLQMHLRIIINVLEGLHYAHELCGYDGTPLSLVHRDVSPQNVFVTYDGQVKILDFGIAKAASSSTNTATGVVKGKIAYMAPEQMVVDTVDRRADLYSVGCMLWRMATGSKLWKDTPDVQLMRRVLAGDIPSPQTVNPGCDDELARIVSKALRHDREQRYATALELQEDLEHYSEKLKPPVKQKLIGAYVSELFGDTRAEIKALVERQLMLLASDNTATSSEFSFLAEQLGQESRSTLVRSASSQVIQVPGLRNNRWTWGLALLLGGALAAGYWLYSRKATQEAALAEVRSQKSAEQATKPALPGQVTVQLRSQPSHARLFLNDRALPTNPTTKILPADGTVYRVRAEADGYEAASTEFAARRNETIELELTKSAPEPNPPTRSVRRGRAARAVQAPVSAAPAAQPAKPDCSAPFVIDANGIKKIRPECM
jgi:eukaryotic-like serine/threonine-protein kinase